MSKTGLVLAGGGSRGAYQLGVWQAAQELGIDFDVVTGASVGALNGALIVQGDFELAKQLWENISSRDVVKLDGMDEGTQGETYTSRQVLKAFAAEAASKGGADIAPLTQMVEKYIDEDKIRRSDTQLGIVTVEYPSFTQLELSKEDIPYGMIGDFLLASAACFPAFKAKEIEGVQYIDGGYYDNLPINLAISLGADRVIAVDLESIGFRRRVTDREVPITYIRSYWNLGNFLLFEKEFAQRNITLGYNDAMKALGKLEGYAYTFGKGEVKKNARRLNRGFREGYGGMGAVVAETKTPEVLLRLITRLILGDLRKHRSLSRTITLTELFTASGELCAEMFGIDPLPVYTMSRFNATIIENYIGARNSAQETIARLKEKGIGAKEFVRSITHLERRDIVSLLCDRFGSYEQSSTKDSDLAVICGAFTRETAAAFYLSVLLYSEKISVKGRDKD